MVIFARMTLVYRWSFDNLIGEFQPSSRDVKAFRDRNGLDGYFSEGVSPDFCHIVRNHYIL